VEGKGIGWKRKNRRKAKGAENSSALVAICVFSEQNKKAEHDKRLTAFKRAGVENYLYWKRCEDENQMDKKADHIVHR